MKKLATTPFVPAPATKSAQLAAPGLLIFAWAATLLLSALPTIATRELHIFQSVSLLHFRLALLVVLLLAGYVWKPARQLRPYFIIFLVLFLAEALADWVSTTAAWQNLLVGVTPAFAREMFGSQSLRLASAFTMLVVVALVRASWGKFLLSKGDLHAEAEPVRWLGMDKALSWSRFGLILAACITSGTLLFLIISAPPTGTFLERMLPLLPLVLLLAGMNAFSEEVIYRGALLAPLNEVLGKSQALLLTAVLFGLWHFYGVPYGVVGVVMAGVLGWLLGKSMLETKGIFWAVFIHFWQDVAIFAFIAAGSVAVNG